MACTYKPTITKVRKHALKGKLRARAERGLTWTDDHPAAPLLLVHPRSPASGALLPGPRLSTVPKGLKEFYLLRFKIWK